MQNLFHRTSERMHPQNIILPNTLKQYYELLSLTTLPPHENWKTHTYSVISFSSFKHFSTSIIFLGK